MKTKLLSLLVCAAGAITAQATVGDVVTSLDQISSNTAYTIKVNRGYMPNGDSSTQLYGTDDAAAAGKFLIIKVDDFSFTNTSNYVIYSLDQNKFMTNRSQNVNVYDETPAQALFNISAANQANTFIIKSSKTDNWLQFGGSSQFVLTDATWKTQDDGNRWTLSVAEENVDNTGATTKLNTYLDSYVKTIEDLNNNSTYIIKNVNRAFVNTNATVALAGKANYAEVAVLKGNKGYYLYDVAHDKFIGTENLTSTDQPIAHYSIQYAAEGSTDKYNFILVSSSNDNWLLTNGVPTLTITDSWKTADDGDKWSFTLADNAFDSTGAMAKIADMEADLAVSDPISDLSSLATTQQYLLKNRGHDGYLKGNTNGEHLQYVATADANLKDPAYHWAIVNIPDEGYVLRNVGTGTYITNLSTASSAQEWRMTNAPVFVYNTLTEYSDESENKFFAVGNVDQTGDYAYLHVDGSGNTVNWEPSNANTQYSIIPCGSVEDYATTVSQELLTAATNKITALTSTGLNPEGTDDRIGYLTAKSNTNLSAAYNAANAVNATGDATIHQKVAEVRNLNSAIASAVYAHVEAGKYYTIRGAHADHAAKYLTESYEQTEVLSDVTYNKLVAAPLAENPVPAYWSFNVVEGEGNTAKYNIAAANSGNFMREAVWTKTCVLLPTGHSEVGVYNYMEKALRQFGGVTLRCSDGTLTITDGYADDNNIKSWNLATDGNSWVIELAESVPVTFNEQGYAAVQYPFAVQLPDGVSAYDLSIINETNDAVTIARTGNVVPANTPVFLKGETSAALTIVPAAAEAVVAETVTTLQGTLMPATVENAFVLSGNQLVPAEGNVPANSAYYVSTEGDTSPKTIGGDITTGINELNTDATVADGAIYDLQGRRVSRVTKGLYIINGKKVFVK